MHNIVHNRYYIHAEKMKKEGRMNTNGIEEGRQNT
jgi:hypothetical protein